MISSTNGAHWRRPNWGEIGSEVGRDLVYGGMVCARMLTILLGCATLLIGSTLAVSGDARGRIIEQAIHYMTRIAPDAVTSELARLAANVGDDDEVGADPRKSALVDDLASAQATVSLDPQQRRVTDYLARRYRVADEAVKLIVAAAYDSGRVLGLDPLLILAVTAVESSMNPFAQSGVGAQGLMQVMTRVHSRKFEAHGGNFAALDPIANLKVGSEILNDYVRRGGSIERGLQLYVGAGNLPDDNGYAARVMAEFNRLKLAAGLPARHVAANGRA